MNAKMLRVMGEFLRTPWAMLPEYLSLLTGAVQTAAAGDPGELDELLARQAAAARQPATHPGGIAVLPLVGIFTQRGSLWDELLGGGSVPTQRVTETVRQLAADRRVAAIVLDIDSPGGSVGGLQELSDTIHEARAHKPVIAVANSLAASAAYWVGSAAAEVVVTPEGQAGSIGVWTAHVNAAEFYRRMGVEVTLVSAGKYKTEGHPFGPLGDEARAHLQSQVDDYYDLFVRAVKRNRGAETLKEVREGYGEGRVLTAQAAVKANLADRVAPMSQVLAELQERLAPSARTRAEIDARRRREQLARLG
jgi:signal peptide peptidase SppA